MSKRAVLYARVSGDDRQNEDRNLNGQLAMCCDYAETHGYEVVAQLAEDDRGASGAAFELPKLNELRRMAEKQVYDVLIVREIDRLSRNLAKQLIVEEELRRAGITIEYVIGEYSDDPEGRLSKHIKATIAEYEREKIRERMMRGRLLKVAAGNVHVHGRPPFGYRLTEVDGKEMLEIVEEEAAVVRQIFAWYTVGDEEHGPYSLRGIRRLLNERKVPTPGDRGKPTFKKRGWGEWSASSVSLILNSETYAGRWRYQKSSGKRAFRYYADLDPDSELVVHVPAIIDSQTWEKARAQILTNRQERAGHVKRPYLMRRRLRCAHCDGPVVCYYGGAKPYYYGYYSCSPASGKGEYDHGCPALAVSAEAVDEAVWAWLKGLLLDDGMLLRGLLSIQASAEEVLVPRRGRLAAVEQEVANVQNQMGRLLDLYLAAKLPRELLDERSARLQEQAHTLQAEAKSLRAQLEAQAVTDERIADARAFAATIADRLGLDDGFEMRQFVVETLDVRGELFVTPDERALELRCWLGDGKLALPSRSNHIAAPEE